MQKGFGNEKKEIKVIRLRPEKDDSDTQSAMNYAIRTGAKKIVKMCIRDRYKADRADAFSGKRSNRADPGDCSDISDGTQILCQIWG